MVEIEMVSDRLRISKFRSLLVKISYRYAIFFIFFAIFSHPLYPRSDFFLHKSQHSAFLPLLEKKHFTSSFYIDYGELHDN